MKPEALHIACVHCGATNRVPAGRLSDGPVCGRCGQGLLEGTPVELTDANFDAVVGHTDLLKGRALLAKVNSDDNPALSQRFGIRSIPTLVRLQKGRETQRQAGAVPASTIVALASV